MVIIALLVLLAVLLKVQGCQIDIQLGLFHSLHFTIVPIKPVREYYKKVQTQEEKDI